MVSARFLSIAEQGRSNTSMTVSSIPSNLETHPVETVDQSDLFGMGDLERFGSQIVPLVDPYGGGFETQQCATVEYGDETLDLQRDQIAEDAEIPEVAVLVGYDEIQSYHPVQTPFHIHAPDVLER